MLILSLSFNPLAILIKFIKILKSGDPSLIIKFPIFLIKIWSGSNTGLYSSRPEEFSHVMN